MPKPRQEDRVKRWTQRLDSANKAFDRWDKRFECTRLEDYYAGRQWYGYPEPKEDDPRSRPYTINLIFPTIETQQPSLMFYRPTVKIEPRPPYSDDPGSDVAARAKLCEDTVQTFIDDPAVHFKLQTTLAMRDAWFRFGLVEVGYTADWIDNPHAGKPVLKESDAPMVGDDGEPIMQPDKIIKKGSEQLFLKRIDPQSVRVSISGKNVLTENDWVGYFEWVYVEDLKRNPKYKNTADLKPGGRLSDTASDPADTDAAKHAGMVKLWRIWDLRQKVKHVIAEGQDKFLVEGESWSFLPLSPLKYHELSNEWYPLPAVYNWISPQDEINETREMQRVHRRRFTRRYTYQTGAIDETELNKLETGGDGVYAKRNTEADTLIPVQDAPLTADWNQLAATKDDFQQITGVTGEQRGAPEAQTATQANIASVKAQIRESSMRVQVGDWLGDISRIMLLTIRERMQLPFWIKLNADLVNPQPDQIAAIAQAWKEIKTDDLGKDALDVSIDVTSLSPVSMDAQRADWNQVLLLITNPALAFMFSMSDILLRKTLKYYGVASDADVKEIQNVLQAQVKMQLASMMGAGGGAAPQAMGGDAGAPAGMPATMGAPLQ